jgi:hypothetical protein
MRYFLHLSTTFIYLLIFIACSNRNNKTVKISTAKMERSTQVQPAIAISVEQVATIDTLASLDRLATAVDTGFKQFAFIADNKYIILSNIPDQLSTAGVPRLPAADYGDGIYRAVTNVKTASLPAAYASLLHKKFYVCSGNARYYTATVSSFKIYAAIIPFSLQLLQGNETPGDTEQPYTDQHQALDIFNKGARFLVAEFELDAQAENTDKLYFAVPKSKPAPLLLPSLSKEVTNANKKSIFTSLIKTNDYIKIQQEYNKEPENKGINWWQDKTAQELFTSYTLNKKRFYVIGHYAGNACSSTDFFGQRFSIWKTEENASPEQLFMGEAYYTVLAATDIDADSIPEFLIEDSQGARTLFKYDKGSWGAYYQWQIPNHTCGC